MSDFKYFKNVISSSAGLVAELIELTIIPKLFIDENTQVVDDIEYLKAIEVPEKIIFGCKIIKYTANATYYYDEYFEKGTKVQNKVTKWLIYGLVMIHVILIGLVFYQLLKQDKATKNQLSKLFSGYIGPVVGLGIAIFCVVLAYKAEGKNWRHKTQAILDLISNLLSLWKFEPVKQALLKNPKGLLIVGGIGFTNLTLSCVKLKIMPTE